MNDELPETGACWNCGFLCRRDAHNLHVSAYYEATEHIRQWDRYFDFAGPLAPWCYRDVPLLLEVEEIIGMPPRIVTTDAQQQERQNAAAKQIVKRDRQCPKWYPYKPGRGPEQHLREVEALELEDRRREFERRMESGRRKWERRLELDRRGFEKTLWDQAQEAEEKRHNLVFWIAIAAVVLAVAEVLAAILSAGPDSIIGRLLGL
jgi:hypothetical protein